MWYICERRKMKYLLIYAILTLSYPVLSKNIVTTEAPVPKNPVDDSFDNNIIDFDEDYSVKFDKQYGMVPWHSTDKFNKESHRYTVIKDHIEISSKIQTNKDNKTSVNVKKDKDTQIKINDTVKQIVEETTASADYSVIPLELVSTTENLVLNVVESTTEPDLAVIPLSTKKKGIPNVEIKQSVVLPSTPSPEVTTEYFTTTLENVVQTTTVSQNNETTTAKQQITTGTTKTATETTVSSPTTTENVINSTTTTKLETLKIKVRNVTENPSKTKPLETATEIQRNATKSDEVLNTNTTEQIKTVQRADFGSSESQEDVPIFTELDTEDLPDVPEDYYDSKDIVPTTAPKTDALSVIFGLAGSVVESMVESVAERVVPKGIFDLFKRMQRQSEALEAERLRSREENGGLGQFTRGILKTISTGLSKPLSQLMAGAKDIGSLDTDRGFVGSVATGVTSVANVANSVVDAFKDRVQAIYPGTLWCGDGHSATARSSDLGLFFFTDTCCRQHDACKIYIRAGETKYGLTNTGLFTRSHCSCDAKFRECLRKTNSLVSAQIGLTYFNVLGPQCFRRSHPIVRCVKRTRITGQKCEEYELDFTKSKMWQWFDNETF